MNFIKIMLGQMTFLMFVLGGLMNTVESYLPVFIRKSYRYGKFAYKSSTECFTGVIEIPKSWFKHFYVFSSFVFTLTLILVANTYLLQNPIPSWVTNFLNDVAGSTRYSSDTPIATLLAVILLTVQCYRRFYETHFISVFGKDSRINFMQYIVGYIHYAGAALAILVEASNFSTTSSRNKEVRLSDISYVEVFATVLFLWAWWHQFKAGNILANLRKNANGKVVTQKHHIPKGDLFEYISSPHLLSEILMYLALTVILRENSTWFYVFIWVLCNQVEVALLNHWWYRETFPNYPKNRKVLVPFVF